MADKNVPSEASFDFVANEKNILAYWDTHQIFAASLAQTREGPAYVFYDGPPFATGLPHHGHLLASTLKDIIPRYKTMCGYYVERQFGWDCHGLPIEYEIDKKLGMPAQEAAEKLGVAAYNQECRSIVQRYCAEWEQVITRLGRWVDFRHDYKTMDKPFMESVWWAFKQLWDKGLIYQGVKVMPYSTALGTPLSNFEASSNYQDVQDPAITVLFRLLSSDMLKPFESKALYLAIWTTTPWTLPANLGLCVGPEIPYVLLESGENRLVVIAEERVSAYAKILGPQKIVGRFLGKELVGIPYEPLFPFFKEQEAQGAFRVFSDEFVQLTEGTGIVHLAPAFGEDDLRVMDRETSVACVCPLDQHGRFTEEVPFLTGIEVKAADPLIIQQLKEREYLLDRSTIVHSYPLCPRSDTPLIYRAVPSWYVRVTALKDRLLAHNASIHWVPSHIQEGRFGKWLENAKDWSISRNRVWGTPLPLWQNEVTGRFRCIGSVQELEALVGRSVKGLHRDQVDALTFSEPNEPGVYRRISDVLDCWFESGSMPYARIHYPFERSNAKPHEEFSADFIAEGVDQTRGWFYTLMVLSTALFDQPAFKNVIVSGIVLAEDGRKMSKRLKNYTPSEELLDSYGADALRLYLIHSGLVKGEEQRFSDAGVKEMVRSTLLPWANAFKFLNTYAMIDGWSWDKHYQSPTTLLDRWILSRLQTLKEEIENHMGQYQLYQVVPRLLVFIDELTNTYIRLNRSRFWGIGLELDKRAAYSTLFQVIREFSCCMAPFTPFLAEFIYLQLKVFSQKVVSKLSVHLEGYPTPDRRLIDPLLETSVAQMSQILVLGRQKRNEARIKVKVPLKHLLIIHRDVKLLSALEALEKIIQEELNVQKVTYCQEETQYVRRYAKPNSPVLGQRLGARFGQFRQLIEALAETELVELEKVGRLYLAGEEFTEGEILVFREAKVPGVSCDRRIAILLDTTLDANLVAQGLAREVVSRLQKTRKTLGLKVEDRIEVLYQASPDLLQAIAEHREWIAKETLSVRLEAGRIEEGQGIQHDIDDHWLQVVVNKQEG